MRELLGPFSAMRLVWLARLRLFRRFFVTDARTRIRRVGIAATNRIGYTWSALIARCITAGGRGSLGRRVGRAV